MLENVCLSLPFCPTDFSILTTDGIISIPVGSSSAQFLLEINDDVIVEGVEELVLYLFDGDVGGDDIIPDNFMLDHINTSVFIEDNDGMC